MKSDKKGQNATEIGVRSSLMGYGPFLRHRHLHVAFKLYLVVNGLNSMVYHDWLSLIKVTFGLKTLEKLATHSLKESL